MSYWEAQRQIATNELIDSACAAGRSWRARRQQAIAAEKFRIAKEKALEQAKQTGVMPAQFQATVPADWFGEQAGIATVALRELAKYAPNHPLVVSSKCREVVANVTLINYNRANRPMDAGYRKFAPDDVKSQVIFKAYPGTAVQRPSLPVRFTAKK